MTEQAKCTRCGADATFTLTPHLIHYAKITCSVRTCGWFTWVPKPDAAKVKRPASHRDLVERFSRGFCELCLRRKEELPARCTLEGHHVEEFQDGGEATRENVQIVCTECHKQIAWIRRNIGGRNRDN